MLWRVGGVIPIISSIFALTPWLLTPKGTEQASTTTVAP
jgi:hypothetical protein